MQSETSFQSSHQLKSYVASKSRLKLAARAVMSADAGLLVPFLHSVDSTRGFAHAIGFAAARRRLRFLVKHSQLRNCEVAFLSHPLGDLGER